MSINAQTISIEISEVKQLTLALKEWKQANEKFLQDKINSGLINEQGLQYEIVKQRKEKLKAGQTTIYVGSIKLISGTVCLYDSVEYVLQEPAVNSKLQRILATGSTVNIYKFEKDGASGVPPFSVTITSMKFKRK